MRAGARNSDLILLMAGLTAMLAMTGLSFVLAAESGAPQHAGSSYATAPDGAKAAYVLLKDAGFAIRRSFEPCAVLRADPGRTVLVLADPFLPASRQDVAALAAFADAGGIVLATGPPAARFLPGLELRGAPTRTTSPARSYGPSFPSSLTRSAPAIEMTPAGPLLRVADPAWVAVYGNYEDAAVLTTRRGAGRMIWWASSRPMSNAAIASPGHLELLLNALGPAGARDIVWDEHYHGYARSIWSYARGTPVAWALLQLGAIAAAALFTFARRHGPIRSLPDQPRTSPLEFIDTMGALYERARPATVAVSTALSRTRRICRSLAGLPASASDDRLARAMADRFLLDGAAVAGVFSKSAIGAGDAGLSDRDAIRLVFELQSLAANATEMHGAPRTTTHERAQPKTGRTG